MKGTKLTLAGAVLALSAGQSMAFDDLVVFGDSLSDMGNAQAFAATQFAPGSDLANGIAALSAAVAGFQADAAAAVAAIPAAQAAAVAAGTAAAVAAAAVTTAEGDVVTAQAAVTTAEGELLTLQGALQTVLTTPGSTAAAIQAAFDDVAAKEAEIATLEAAVDAAVAAVATAQQAAAVAAGDAFVAAGAVNSLLQAQAIAVGSEAVAQAQLDELNLTAAGLAIVPARFTNSDGVTAVETLAANLPGGAVTLTASGHLTNPGGAALGNNMATGGAVAITTSTTFDASGNFVGGNDLFTQYGAYMLTNGALNPTTFAPVPGTLNANALYTIIIGGNDAANARDAIVSAATTADRIAQITSFLSMGTEIGQAVGALGTAGATKFLVASSPDVGATPRFGGNDALGTALSGLGSVLIGGGVEAAATNLALGGLSIFPAVYDLGSAVEGLIAGGTFTNTTDFCLENYATLATTGGVANCPDMLSVVTNSNGYLYWDNFHPTTEAHQAVGAQLAGVATVLDAL